MTNTTLLAPPRRGAAAPRRFSITWRAGALVCLLLGLSLVDGCRSSQPVDALQTMAEAKATFREAIEKAIDDPERARSALASWETYEAHESAFLSRARDLRARLFELNADPGSARADFEVLLRELDSARAQFATEIVADFGSLRDTVTAEEWGTVFAGVRELDGRWEELVR